ncbi:uncharacterized protein [Littorina saxatilis]|uniref:Uncharacterized protein n=1 Tax=Littorina saxatilis TaxID=31220 RepID=A0AAN9FZ89_9CAEN
MANTRFQFIDIICLLSLTLLLYEVASVEALMCVQCTPADPGCESGNHDATECREVENFFCSIYQVKYTWGGYESSFEANSPCGKRYCRGYCENNVCKVKAGMTCTTDPADQCIMGATCVSSKCKCKANHTASDDMTKCLHEADFRPCE